MICRRPEEEEVCDGKHLEWRRGESERAIWLIQNIQRLSDVMGMTFEEVEAQLAEMLGEIERRRNVRKRENELVTRDRKKQGDGEPRELKRLQSSINYNGRKNSGQRREGGA